MDDLIATLELVMDATSAGELDAKIEHASRSLRAGFAKKEVALWHDDSVSRAGAREFLGGAT